MRVAVIGACNFDIFSRIYSDASYKDSNPGKIKMGFGGVGRNVAHNLSLLGQTVSMFTALSNDLFGRLLMNSCSQLRIDISNAIFTDDYSQSMYLCVNDKYGDMLIGSSDMEIMNLITIDYLKENLNRINYCDVVVFDTNLSEELMEFVITNVTKPLFLDTVSTKKSAKLANIIKKGNITINTIKANKYEAEVLANHKINDDSDLEFISNYLHNQGIKNVCISLGENGAFYSSLNENIKHDIIKTEIINTTGAGDAFLAGLIYGSIKTTKPKEIIKYALATSYLALQSTEAVNNNMTESKITEIIKEKLAD